MATRRLIDALPELDTTTRIHVVQSSNWSQARTKPDELTFLKDKVDYTIVDGGNAGDNETADLRLGSRTFEAQALSGWRAEVWDAAFNQLSASDRIDFANMVGFLHVLGIDKTTVDSVDDFAQEVMR